MTRVLMAMCRSVNGERRYSAGSFSHLGSTGSWPVAAGSSAGEIIFGKLPKTISWQPVLPRCRLRERRFSDERRLRQMPVLAEKEFSAPTVKAPSVPDLRRQDRVSE